MDEKSSNLIKILGKVYENPTVQSNPELKTMVGECARPLMGNDDDKVYFEVISKLTHNVAKYYHDHGEIVPTEIAAIYQQIKQDIPEDSRIGDRLHGLAKSEREISFIGF